MWRKTRRHAPSKHNSTSVGRCQTFCDATLGNERYSGTRNCSIGSLTEEALSSARGEKVFPCVHLAIANNACSSFIQASKMALTRQATSEAQHSAYNFHRSCSYAVHCFPFIFHQSCFIAVPNFPLLVNHGRPRRAPEWQAPQGAPQASRSAMTVHHRNHVFPSIDTS